jgi:hypothetical protein
MLRDNQLQYGSVSNILLNSDVKIVSGGICSTYRRDEESTDKFTCKTERKGQHGSFKHRLENNVKINLKKVRCGGVKQNSLSQFRVQWKAFVNIGIDFDSIRGGEFD